MKVGFIGLGRMGGPMSRNIVSAGHSLYVYDVLAEACYAAADGGATALGSPADVARYVEAVILSVPGPAEVDAVMNGADGLLSGAQEGLLVIDATTITPKQSRDLAHQCRELGVDHIDAPVSGAQHGAVDGTLTVMVGGDEPAFQRALPLLRCIGSNIRHIGPSGSGSAIKVINQAVYVVYMAAFGEGLALGERLGLDLDTMLDVLGTSAAGHPMMQTKYDDIRARLTSPGFAIERAAMFVEFARRASEDAGFPDTVFEAVAGTLQDAVEHDRGSEDVIVSRIARR